MTKKIINAIMFLVATFCFGQNYDEPNVNKEVKNIYLLSFKNADEVIEAGKKILTISRTDNETSKGYYLLFMGFYLKGDYSNSIFYAKKADLFFLKNHKTEDHFIASYYLSLSYQKSGFMRQAYQNLAESEKVAKKLSSSNFLTMLLRLKANFLENQKKYHDAIAYRIKNNDSHQEKNIQDSSVFVAGHCFLAFDYLMTGNVVKAKEQLAIYEGHKKEAAYYNYRIEVYYACKAIIAIKENNKLEAAYYFDKAILTAKESETYDQLTTLLELRLKFNIDNAKKREELFSEFVHLKDRAKKESVEVITEEINRRNAELQRQKEYKYIMILVGLLLSLGLVIFKRKKRQNQKKYFEEIIQKLENKRKENLNVLEQDINTNQATVTENCQDSSLTLLEGTEVELLKKLDIFENGNAFTAKNFTLNNFVSILDTNTKYVNYVLKEHRGKNFSEYINDLRIKYILEYLHDNPESLKYKLNHLSDLAGFSSHSYFTKVFTKKTKITPSKFISALKEKNKNTEKK